MSDQADAVRPDPAPSGGATPGMSAIPDTPRVSVVIPVMGHPVLVDDAIASAAALLDRGEVGRIIVVNDGCRFAETRASLASWAALLGHERLTVVPQPNLGLSAARNAGIDVAMADPDGPPDAIFMLDADNRLAAGAGEAFREALNGRPDDDWFYPPFDFFGQDGHYAGETAPTALMHMLANHSEAGSLIRTRVFASGLRFAEDLREGYEDWDFFLAAAGRGFTGTPVGRPMLQYRKRPASMLAGSHELDTRLRSQLRSRHKWLFSTREVLRREAEAFPRYAITEGPGSAVLVGTDPARLQAWPHEGLETSILRHLSAPLHHHAPPYLVVMAEETRRTLTEAGLLRGILWNLERRFARDESCEVASVAIMTAGEIGWQEQAEGNPSPAIVVLGPRIVSAAIVDGKLPARPAALRERAVPSVLRLPNDLAAAVGSVQGDGMAAPARALLAELAESRFRESLHEHWDWRDKGGARSRADAITAPRLVAGGGVVLPLLGTPGARLEIGFTVPIFDQGGVEKVVLQLARVLTAAGHACHLFVIGPRPAHLSLSERKLFASINFFPDPSASDWGGSEYFGTAETSWGSPAERADLIGLLRPMDLVIDAHAPAVHKVASALRAGGTRMADHEHLLEMSKYGRAYGPPMLALAYENAYDRILTCSAGLGDWLGAHGVPRDKLMPIINAPGYPMTAEEVAASLASRVDPHSDRTLQILYLGRLDEQKGIDRVAAVFSRLAAAVESGGPRFRLTVGGRSVVGNAAAVDWPAGTRILGAVEGAEALSRAFAAADILVLPSRYEGLPLVLLEAQRLGCVPIATDVGSVREAIRDGVTGFVVDEDDVVETIVGRILALDADRERLARMSTAASTASRSWEEAAAPLIAWCEAIYAASKASEAAATSMP